MRNIYLVQTYTGSVPSRIINTFLREKYVHISISLDETLDDVYGFGQFKSVNPFVGGFQKEDMAAAPFSAAKCRIHKVDVSKESYKEIKRALEAFNQNGDKYRFSILGLLTAYVRIPWQRKYHYFCSEFVSELLTNSRVVNHSTPHSIIRPEELIQEVEDIEVVYEGSIAEYKSLDIEKSHRLATFFQR